MTMTFERLAGRSGLGCTLADSGGLNPNLTTQNHNNQTAEHSLVIMQQQICHYCSCWRWQCVIGHGIGRKYIPIMAHLAKARCWSKQ